MKILVAPDSFKGSLSAPQAAEAIIRGWRRVFPNDSLIPLPVADGGEGTLDALITATGGEFLPRTVTGPLGEPIMAQWGRLGDGETAVVELAQAAGLTRIPEGMGRNPNVTTTRGVGELLLDAVRSPGIRRVIVGLGGSATNDGGAGMLAALGVRFAGADGEILPDGGAALRNLTSVDGTHLALNPETIEVWIACDVDNPLTGPRGASAIFGPQKGATPDDVRQLDAALGRFAEVLDPPGNGTYPGGRLAGMPGAGAAGGTAFGLLWLFPKASLRSGIELVLDAVRFDSHLADADLVLTGEGRLDAQTLGGKAVAGVARRARAMGVPVAALVGGLGADLDLARLADETGVSAVLPMPPAPCTLEEAMANAGPWLADAAERAARWLVLAGAFPARNV